jgi:hypothetical protein
MTVMGGAGTGRSDINEEETNPQLRKHDIKVNLVTHATRGRQTQCCQLNTSTSTSVRGRHPTSSTRK